ncbi:MAG TPA: M48 family metalloprotease [Tepidisphaeraceae bacterium]|nr:M48 family metalloprotease [Tepidisphaeraceae bacterium]
MSQPFVIIPIVLWLVWSEQNSPRARTDWFMIGLLGAVIFSFILMMRAWSRLTLRSFGSDDFERSSRRFGWSLLTMRFLIVAGFALALFGFGYGDAITKLLEPLENNGLRLPGLVLGTAPIFLAMIGLWWAAYPVERGHREAQAQELMDNNLPVHMPPSVGRFLWLNVRMQLLVTATPVFAGLMVSDVASAVLKQFGLQAGPALNLLLFLITLAVVFVLSPWLLTKVLDADRMPDTPLRRRLETLAERLNVRCRDVLIWRTGHGVGNAMVVGLVPRMRYILLTDLLLDTLSDRQIEAVFAHEVGHIRHRHIAWYLVMIASLLIALSGPIAWLTEYIHAHVNLSPDATSFIVGLPVFILFIIAFGIVSRLFERQADAFAARTMQSSEFEPALEPTSLAVESSGADAFSSALKRVAQINHMPLSDPPRGRTLFKRLRQKLIRQFAHFRHPSVARRVEAVHHLARHPDHSARFDRLVAITMILLLALMVVLAGITLAAYL